MIPTQLMLTKTLVQNVDRKQNGMDGTLTQQLGL
jgi:hypothetical protein